MDTKVVIGSFYLVREWQNAEEYTTSFVPGAILIADFVAVAKKKLGRDTSERVSLFELGYILKSESIYRLEIIPLADIEFADSQLYLDLVYCKDLPRYLFYHKVRKVLLNGLRKHQEKISGEDLITMLELLLS